MVGLWIPKMSDYNILLHSKFNQEFWAASIFELFQEFLLLKYTLIIDGEFRIKEFLYLKLSHRWNVLVHDEFILQDLFHYTLKR